MKVKELIKELEKCDQNAVVCVYNECEESDMYVKTVKEMVYHSEDKHEDYGIYDKSERGCLYCKNGTVIEERDRKKLVVLCDDYFEELKRLEAKEEKVYDCPFKVGDVVVPAENVRLVDLPENAKKLTIAEINSNGQVDIDVETDDDKDSFLGLKWRIVFVNPQDLRLAGDKNYGR
jgi:hypothetical protein